MQPPAGIDAGLPLEALWGPARDVAALCVAAAAGWIGGRWASGLLGRWGLDAWVAPPWPAAPLRTAAGSSARPGEDAAAADDDLPAVRAAPRLSSVWGALVGLVLAAAGAWAVAGWHAAPAVQAILERAANYALVLALVGTLALALARAVAAAVLAMLDNDAVQRQLDGLLPNAPGREPFSTSLGRLLGIAIYATVFLLALLVAADTLGWGTTGAAAAALWQLGLRLGTATLALVIGWIGLAWARGQAPSPGAESKGTEARDRRYSLGFVAVTTLVALVLLAGGIGAFGTTQILALAVLIAVVAGLWTARDALPDLWAGFYLRLQGVREVTFDGASARVDKVGLFSTGLRSTSGRAFEVRNREVMRAA